MGDTSRQVFEQWGEEHLEMNEMSSSGGWKTLFILSDLLAKLDLMKETNGQMCKNTTARINRLKEVTERDITYVKKKKRNKKGWGFWKEPSKTTKKNSWVAFI